MGCCCSTREALLTGAASQNVVSGCCMWMRRLGVYRVRLSGCSRDENVMSMKSIHLTLASAPTLVMFRGFPENRARQGLDVSRPVGTRGVVGWRRGPGACPRGDTTGWLHAIQTTRHAGRTSTRPPPCSASTPGPYRTEADLPNPSPVRLSKIIRVTVQPVKDSSS
jgi:hypothetical protein